MSARQDVLARLGGGNAAAGEAVVRFVEEALAANREEIAGLVGQHNDRVAASEERIAGLEASLQDSVSRADHEAVLAEVTDLRQRLLAAAAALGGAVSAHNQAVADATPNNVGAALAATGEAEEAGSDYDARIESLEARVSELESWRQDHVDPTLADHEERIAALENRAEPIVIAQPDPGPVPVALLPDEPEPAPEVHNPPTRIDLVARDANPRNWGTNPFAWGLAIIGLVVGVCVGWWLFQESDKILWGLIAFLFVPVTAAVGFFGGGLVGHRLTQRQSMVRPAEA